MMHQPPKHHTHILDSFSLCEPTLSLATPDGLFVVDTTNHIYKFSHKNVSEFSSNMDNDESLIDTSLEIVEGGNLLGVGKVDEVQEECVLRMEAGVKVNKIWAGGQQHQHANQQGHENGHGDEFLVVGVSGGGVRIWVKQTKIQEESKEGYKVVSLQGVEQSDAIIDFNVQSIQNSLIIVFVHRQSPNQITIKKYKLTSTGLLSFSSPKQIQVQNSLWSRLKLVNRNRELLSESSLLTINQKHTTVLPTSPPKQILHIDFIGEEGIVYSDGTSVWVRSREQKYGHGSGKIVEAIGASVIGIRVVENASKKVVFLFGQKPTMIYVCSVRGNVLWSIPCPQIQTPLLIQNSNIVRSIQILDKSHLKCHQYPIQTLLTPPTSLSLLSAQWSTLHSTTMSSLKHRSQILTTLSSYTQNQNYGAVFRYLHNSNKNMLLNDGLLYLYEKLKPTLLDKGQEIVKEIITNAGNLVLESKYESHIQNGLTILLGVVKDVVGGGREGKVDARVWKITVNGVKELVDNKKIKKLQQQNKNKTIFQLTYELVHTANSHLLRN